MTSSRSQAIFFVSNMFSVGSALVQHWKVKSSWQKTSEQDHFLGCRCLGGQWLFCDETEKKIVALSSVSTVLILDMSIFRGLVVLRKALDQFVSIEKNNVLLKMIS